MQEDEPNQNLRKCFPLMNTTKQEGFVKRDDNGNLHTVAHEIERTEEREVLKVRRQICWRAYLILSRSRLDELS
jgi:hypothetical protein